MVRMPPPAQGAGLRATDHPCALSDMSAARGCLPAWRSAPDDSARQAGRPDAGGESRLEPRSHP